MDRLQAVLEAIPYGVMLSDPIRDSTGTVVNFWLRAFNLQAQREAPGLKGWYLGATLFESFPTADQAGLFALYLQVLSSGQSFQARYESPGLGQAYQLRIERLGPTLLAMSVPLKPGEAETNLSLDCLTPLHQLLQGAELPHFLAPPEVGSVSTPVAFENLVARYRRAIYERFQAE